MKPTTKLQKRVYELSQTLPTITEEQREYGHKHCFDHFGYRIKRGTSCLECGELFQTKLNRCKCPKCGTMLKIEDTRVRKLKTKSYYGILTTCKGFQVIRLFMQTQWLKVGVKSNYYTTEVVQHWLRPDGRSTVVALSTTFGYAYSDQWNSFSSMEIRNLDPSKHDINPMAIYPKRGIISTLKRNGFKGSCHEITPSIIFRRLLCGDTFFETLFKAGYYKLIRHAVRGNFNIERCWNSIKICLRNNYPIKDASIWCDYIDLLTYFNRDLRNAKYVCPANLNREHDRLMRKKQQILDDEARERRASKLIGDEKMLVKHRKEFEEQKGRFFDIVLDGRDFKIVVIKSVDDYKVEGDTLHHCVFTNQYYRKADILVFSARSGDQRIATIELSLDTLEIIQCRGSHNSKPKQYDQIVSLINKNIGAIQRRITA